jgi:hypothetical protein
VTATIVPGGGFSAAVALTVEVPAGLAAFAPASLSGSDDVEHADAHGRRGAAGTQPDGSGRRHVATA